MANRELQQTATCRLRPTTESISVAHRSDFKSIQAVEKPVREWGRSQSLNQGLRILEEKLAAILDQPDSVDVSELAAVVTAVSLARISCKTTENRKKTRVAVKPASISSAIPAESVVDYAEPESVATIAPDQATEQFLWRRELETLWRTHITKDDFHRPVVRSLGIPVLAIVDQVRKGFSWRTICDNYRGLTHDDIRACVSLATECGWYNEDDAE